MTKKKQGTTIRFSIPFADIQVFGELTRELRFVNRFFLSERPARFVEDLVNYAKQFKVHRFASDSFYRARIYERDQKEPHPLDMMGTPPAYSATQGRINPVGIPYLYLANDIDTAVAEVRPWIGCKSTVAEFTLNQEISVINFSNKVFKNIPAGEDYEGSEFTWRELVSYLFSMPIDPRDEVAYAGTQYLAERIKKEEFDGILYDSALNKAGYNLALFNQAVAKPVRRFDVEVTAVSYEKTVSE